MIDDVLRSEYTNINYGTVDISYFELRYILIVWQSIQTSIGHLRTIEFYLNVITEFDDRKWYSNLLTLV